MDPPMTWYSVEIVCHAFDRREHGFRTQHGAVLEEHGAGGLEAEHLNREAAPSFRHEREGTAWMPPTSGTVARAPRWRP